MGTPTEAPPLKTRSLITIATLAALRVSTELQDHVRGALRNGCSVEEIQAVLLQSGVYCGMQAGDRRRPVGKWNQRGWI